MGPPPGIAPVQFYPLRRTKGGLVPPTFYWFFLASSRARVSRFTLLVALSSWA